MFSKKLVSVAASISFIKSLLSFGDKPKSCLNWDVGGAFLLLSLSSSNSSANLVSEAIWNASSKLTLAPGPPYSTVEGIPNVLAKLFNLCIPLLAMKLSKVALAGFHCKAISCI